MDSNTLVKVTQPQNLQSSVDFFHYSQSGGESFIAFSSLNWPSAQQIQYGLTNPNPSRLLTLGLQQYKTSMMIRSTSGRAYSLFSFNVTSTGIQLLNGLTTLAGEMLHFHVDAVPNSFVLPPDIKPLFKADVMTEGQTDFDIGEMVSTVYPPTIKKDDVTQYQCTSNSLANEGDFIIVDAGSGYGRLIRFKESAPQKGWLIDVRGTHLITRPDASMMAYIEKMQGQVNQLITAVSEDTGLATSFFNYTATSPDLAYFGNTLNSLNASVQALLGRVGIDPGYQYTLTVTGANWTTARAVGIIYKTSDNTYRIRFNITGSIAGTITSFTGTIFGVNIKTGFDQGIALAAGWGGQSAPPYQGLVFGGTQTFYISGPSMASPTFRISGDVELDSKPTWATNTP